MCVCVCVRVLDRAVRLSPDKLPVSIADCGTEGVGEREGEDGEEVGRKSSVGFGG